MTEPGKSFLQKLGPEAAVTVIIAAIAVLVTVIAFRQHTIDFEQVAQRDMQRIEARIANVEERERFNTMILTRVDTHVEALREDIASLQRLVATILTRLPSNDD